MEALIATNLLNCAFCMPYVSCFAAILDFSQTFLAMLLWLVGTADTAGVCEKESMHTREMEFPKMKPHGPAFARGLDNFVLVFQYAL